MSPENMAEEVGLSCGPEILIAGLRACRICLVHRIRKRLYPFFIFFLGAQCVESGVSCTDCY